MPVDGALPYSIIKTTGHGEGAKIASDYYCQWMGEQPADSGNKLLIVGVGGDGTLHDVMQNLSKNNNVIFGVLPCGSGNDLGNNLGLSRLKMDDAAYTLRWGTPVPYGAYSFTAAPLQQNQSEGSVKVAAETSADAESYAELKTGWVIDEFDLGRGAEAGRIKHLSERGEAASKLVSWSPSSYIYPASMLAAWVNRKPALVSVTFDEEAPVNIDLSMLVATCGPYSGGGHELNPFMQPSHGFGTALYGGDLNRGSEFVRLCQLGVGIKPSVFTRERFSKLHITHQSGHQPVAVQVDGESRYQTPATVQWHTGVFTIMAPNETAKRW